MTAMAMNIPNALTLLRILLVPALVVYLGRAEYGIALCLLLLAGVSDILDGFIARRWNLCTRLGSFLDPLADKLLIACSYLVLAGTGRLHLWLAAVVIGRDLVIVSGAAAFQRRTGILEMDPSVASKLNTFVQISLVLAVIADGAGLLTTGHWLPALFLVTLATTIVSGGQYVVVWGRRAWGASQRHR
ncbi:MAG TPA: CDP-alcohol phosphatidyltransferase family protein [Geobacteraceae bacterium]